ncbi:MAG: DUF1834 family protein [Nitrospiraceae bacterium]|nr:DUF1834 family protein [Nitrospiraceae bacterium]
MDFETIEDAILTELRTPTLPGAPDMSYIATCERYAGQQFGEADLQVLAVSFPAVFVIMSDMPAEKQDNINYVFRPSFRILAAAENLRGRDEAKQDAYKIVKDVMAVLTNRKFGLDIEDLTLTRVVLVYIDNVCRAVYGIEFQTSFEKSYIGG